MEKQTAIQKILHFFLTKIIIGMLVLAGMIVFIEWFGRLLLDRTAMTDVFKNIIIAIADSAISIVGYTLLFGQYENRNVTELSLSAFGKNAAAGFATGILLQSLFIAVIYLAGGYAVTQINAASYLLPAFAASLTAGFVAEIIIMGIVFRLTEEKFGTVITLITVTLLFALLHINVPGATIISICATAAQAGLLLGAAYIFSRSLWLPIFLHFGWDFAEPGIFGGANPGIRIQQHLFTSTISGSPLLTGGQSGPQNSSQGLILCLLTGFSFLWLAEKKNNFVNPYWKK